MKLKKKQAKLEKNFTHIDNRKKNKVKRGDEKEYTAWLKQQKLTCVECVTIHNIELHHVDSQDDRTCVPFCSYCHRGDERLNRPFSASTFSILGSSEISGNESHVIVKGYYLHRGTRSREFNEKWNKNTLLIIADRLYQEYKSQI